MRRLFPASGGDNDGRFMRTWFRNPLRTGAVLPSSRALGCLMASFVPDDTAPVLELGPGTGAITACLLERGIAPERLFLLEFSPDFCTHLRTRFPGVHVIRADAYRPCPDLMTALRGRVPGCIVSSLPLMTRPDEVREAVLRTYLSQMDAGAPFIQFTYSPGLPVRPERVGASVEETPWVKRNMPPARVVVYRRPGMGAACEAIETSQ